MRVLIVFLVVVALAGAAFGSYALFIQPLPVAVSAGEAEEAAHVAEGELLALRGDMEIMKQKYGTRLEELEELIGQQATRMEELDKQVASLKVGAAAVGQAAGEAAPERSVSLLDADRETLKGLIGELSEERRRDERSQQLERMQTELVDFRSRQIDKAAQKHNWDDVKKQQVMDILAQERARTQEIWQGARGQELSQEARRELMEQMRQVNEQTQEALKALLEEEEYKELQKALKPRRERGQGGRGDRFRPGRGGSRGGR